MGAGNSDERQMKEFAGKTAVVTGAASGIGLAMVERFAAARMNVVMADIEKDNLSQQAERLAALQHNVLPVVTDAMRRESIDNLFSEAVSTFGKVHILCNNAGVVTGGISPPIWEVPDADWEWVMGVNFDGVLHGLRRFVPHMIEHGEPGHIVNTASVAAFMPAGGTYGVSKHGVLVVSEALHRDLAAQGSAIGASVLCPGWVNTKIAEAERNRPQNLTSSHNPDGAPLDMGDALLKGRQPSDIADQVFTSIEQERFYILPHKDWDQVALGRTQAMIDRGDPYQIDMVNMREEGRKSGQDL